MHIFKKFLRGISSQIFKSSLFLIAISVAVIAIIGTASNLKQTLLSDNLYDKIPDIALTAINKESDKQSINEGNQEKSPLDEPDIQAAIKATLTPQLLEQKTPVAIDGIFAWLDGTTEKPEFTIDITDFKLALANNLGDVAVARSEKLATCTNEQLRSISSKWFDLLDLPCLPPGINLQAEKAIWVDKIANGGELIKESELVVNDLPKREDGKYIIEQVHLIPTIYQWSARLPWILGIISLLSAMGLVFLHDDRRRGLFVISRSILISGVMLGILVLVSSYLATNLKIPTADDTQLAAIDVARSIARQFNSELIKFGVAYGLIGVAGLVALHFTKPKTPKVSKDKKDDVADSPETPKEEEQIIRTPESTPAKIEPESLTTKSDK